MAIVKPFCAFRPAPMYASRVAALPYDVYSRKEAREAVKDHPLSFLNIDRPETQFDESADMYAEEVYAKAASLLKEQIQNQIYRKDTEPGYYIYELTMDGRTQTGIVACCSIDDYLNQVIRKHENTREEKEQDRIRHVDVLNMHTGPIFLAYRSDPAVSAVIAQVKSYPPVYRFTSEDGICHAVWRISGPDQVTALEQAFAHIPNTYIADGHHRAASAVKVGLKRRREHPDYTGEEAFNYFLSVLFPDDQLMILPYNRVVRDLNGLSEEEFLARAAEAFTVQDSPVPIQPEEKGTFGMYLNHTWYQLTIKPEYVSQDPVEGLDVSLLQNHLLAPILGILEPRTDDRIDFVGGIRGLKELVHRADTDMTVAFSLYPTSIRELFAVADAGLLMPPKSTWFEPKLRSGLFLHAIGDDIGDASGNDTGDASVSAVE